MIEMGKEAGKEANSHNHVFQPKNQPKNSTNSSTHVSPLDKTVTLKLDICPKKALKWLTVVLLLVGVFYLGRFTANPSANMAADIPATTDDSVDVPAAADSSEEKSVKDDSKEESSFFSSILNSITGLFSASDTDTDDAEEKNRNETNASAAPAAENVTLAAEDNTALENATNDTVKNETEEVEEIVITDYKYVKLTLDNVFKKWMGTWGKITGIEYTIINNEGGTIKPHHFVMIVEGYPDVTKEFIVPYTTEKIKSKVTLKDSAAVSGGFAYNELTAGDLSSVDIQLYLYDASGKVIASTLKAANLQG